MNSRPFLRSSIIRFRSLSYEERRHHLRIISSKQHNAKGQEIPFSSLHRFKATVASSHDLIDKNEKPMASGKDEQHRARASQSEQEQTSALAQTLGLHKSQAIAPVDAPTSDRIWAIPPAWAVHLSIGSIYAYSMYTPSLTSALGVVGHAPLDWTQAQVLPVFSCAAVTFGVTSAVLGGWLERIGPRMSCAAGSACMTGALLTSALGVQQHNLSLIYAGYSILGGLSWTFMYVAPTTSIMKWFPDKRGLAAGIALSAFGAGSAIAPTLIQNVLDYFAVAPDFIGPLSSGMESDASAAGTFVELTTLDDGSQVVADHSPLGTPGQSVVVATESDLTKLSYVHTGPGAYALGTGDTGATGALISLGLFYGALGLLGARNMRLPDSKWLPESMRPEKETAEEKEDAAKATFDVGLPPFYVATNTVQFPLLWVSVMGNGIGGLALLSSSKVMLTDIWAGVAPDIVTSSFATGYVSALGAGMAIGRFGWSAMSDYLGRQNTYTVFGMLCVPIMATAPILNQWAMSASSSDQVAPLLFTFYGGSVLAITCYGGIFSVLPAYIADLFGPKYAGPILGLTLTAFATSAMAGPMGLAYLRSTSEHSATQDLLQTIQKYDPIPFEQTFGCAVSDSTQIARLVDAKTITIQRLMKFTPPGTVDPTPFLYDTTCYAAAGLMSVAVLANLLIRPLDYREIESRLKQEKERSSRKLVNNR